MKNVDRIIQELGREFVQIHSGIGFVDPVVSFCCPTFGLVTRNLDMMNEMVFWYRKQTYPHRELLILNDAPGQKLWCKDLLKAEGIRIINYPMRIKTLGEKRNLLVMLAAGSIILPQDDDDVSLPWRAEQAVAALVKAEYWSPKRWWYYDAHRDIAVPDCNGYGHNCSAYRRSSMYNRYERTTGDEDAKVCDWAMRNLIVNQNGLEKPEDLSYVYRWGVSPRHISGYGGPTEMQKAYESFNPGPDGEYEITGECSGGVDWVVKLLGS